MTFYVNGKVIVCEYVVLCCVLVIGDAVDERSRLSGGSLRASLAAVIDQCRGKGKRKNEREGARTR